MTNLIDNVALTQGIQAAKDYTDEQINSLGDIAVLIKGDKGDQGIQGPQGIPGQDGVPGAQGPKGESENLDQVVQDLKDYITIKFNELKEIIVSFHPNYVAFDSDEPRTITPAYTNSGVTLQYSLDKKTWVNIASGDAMPEVKTIYMRGQATGTKKLFATGTASNTWIFSGASSNKLRITGNLNYLLCNTFGDIEAPLTLGSSCYSHMFYGCTSLVTAPELPATTLATQCYYQMFYGCTSLITAPELPATTLATTCYGAMFQNCTSLIAAPELPAMPLAIQCYINMFEGCTSLVTAPQLPAIIMLSQCYSRMFYGCTSLVTAPELPATTLATQCYSYMFQGCTVLSSVRIHAPTAAPTNALTGMINGVKNIGTLTCKPTLTEAMLATPPGWSRVNF